MKKILFLILILLLAGCETQGETNDRIIKETKKCIEAGLRPEGLGSGMGVITDIQCAPNPPLSEDANN